MKIKASAIYIQKISENFLKTLFKNKWTRYVSIKYFSMTMVSFRLDVFK